MNRLEFHIKAHQILLVLLAFSLPFPLLFSNILIFLILENHLAETKILFHLKNTFKNEINWYLLILYFLFVLSAFISFNTNEIGSDFKYFVSNKQNDINNEVLVDKAKNALSFLNDDPFVINWDIVFDKKNVDSISFILTIRTSGGNYQFTLDAARKTIT